MPHLVTTQLVYFGALGQIVRMWDMSVSQVLASLHASTLLAFSAELNP